MAQNAATRVVCFDLGGVLVRICQSWEEACTFARVAHRPLSAEWIERRRALVDRYQRGDIECAGYHAALSRCFDGEYSETELERIHHAWTLEEYPGVFQLVTALNQKPGLLTACLSNTNHAHWQRLAGVDGRAEYPSVLALRCRLASHLLGRIKPDRDIYEHALTQFQTGGIQTDAALAPEQVAFFDDLPENVAAARELGWRAFRIDPLGDTAAQIRRHLSTVGIIV